VIRPEPSLPLFQAGPKQRMLVVVFPVVLFLLAATAVADEPAAGEALHTAELATLSSGARTRIRDYDRSKLQDEYNDIRFRITLLEQTDPRGGNVYYDLASGFRRLQHYLIAYVESEGDTAVVRFRTLGHAGEVLDAIGATLAWYRRDYGVDAMQAARDIVGQLQARVDVYRAYVEHHLDRYRYLEREIGAITSVDQRSVAGARLRSRFFSLFDVEQLTGIHNPKERPLDVGRRILALGRKLDRLDELFDDYAREKKAEPGHVQAVGAALKGLRGRFEQVSETFCDRYPRASERLHITRRKHP